MSDKRVTVFLMALLVLVVSLVFASAVLAQDTQGRLISNNMTGAKEVPGPGDEDGTGDVTIDLNVHQQTVCWQINVENIEPATAAHIHLGKATVAGPVVVGLSPPTDGWSEGCAEGVDKALIRDIIRNPNKYYVNVHNAPFPGGAVRGQLRSAP